MDFEASSSLHGLGSHDPLLRRRPRNCGYAVDWMRLAQRVPVRVTPDVVPSGVELVVGRTATVTLESGN
jgi:hypothetical protein